MYPVLGDTGIEMYGLLGDVGIYFFYVFNLFFIRKKKDLLSNVSLFISGKFAQTKRFRFLANPYIYAFLEIVLISYLQFGFLLGDLHNGLGGLVKTGSNYFGTALFKPIILFVIFYLLAINPFRQMDLITPAYPIALVFVKLACFCHGCCSGFRCEWGFYNVTKDVYDFPVQLVEAGLALIIFIFLMWYKKRAKEGTLFPIYLIIYSATRFFSEFTRVETNVLGPFKIYHFLCIAGVIVGVAELIIVLKYSEQIKKLYERNIFVLIKESIDKKNKKNKKNNKKRK